MVLDLLGFNISKECGRDSSTNCFLVDIVLLPPPDCVSRDRFATSVEGDYFSNTSLFVLRNRQRRFILC